MTFNELKKNLKKDMQLLPEIKVALLGDTATQLLAISLKGMAYERGFRLNLWEADYGQVERQILDLSSEFYAFQADIVVVFQSTHKLLLHYNQLLNEERCFLAEERIKFIETLCHRVSGKIIYYNYPAIDDAVFGSFSTKVERSFPFQLRKLNYMLEETALQNGNLYLCDLTAIQDKWGRDALFSPSIYINSEMLLSIDLLPCVASRTLDIVCVLQGKLKKCLILDLDNTLWGGVIGDDGLENIQLGHGLGIGKAFTELQQWIKKLQQRGIILAICSKNSEAIAKEPFEKHPEMVLRLDDIAVFIANWNNKADNIRQIQQILNIGFDSMVFLDDNPFERNLVRENIPHITVPELPQDPADYLEYLYGMNLFETVSFSEADRDRTQQYQIEAQRARIRQDFTDEGDFLRNLNMVSEVTGFAKFNIPRVAQLSQRSNQFNLRTVRYTGTDIERINVDENYKGLCFTLEDKFGDNGLIGVVVLEKKGNGVLFIDSWFMSCRVLKRGMENFILNVIVDYACRNGFNTLVGEYIPTSKNGMVADHYLKLGFVPMEERFFQLNVATYQGKECYINKRMIES